ncbi:MAG: hypothetical protein LBH80_06935 [Prevotellaceae bacterium]|jgi:hypothetical protein|nr:hypothetical protein [Prevotellaceae bacterium]
MKRDFEFYERQSRKSWWFSALIAAVNLPFIYGIFRQIILGKPWGTKPASDTELILITVSILLFTVVMLFSKLETIIDGDGIYFRYFPFNPRYKFLSWESISKASIRQYGSMEFGGAGIRFQPWKNSSKTATRWLGNLRFNGAGVHHGFKEKAYIVSGKYGLQLELRNKKKILIGTQRPDEIEELLKKVNG